MKAKLGGLSSYLSTSSPKNKQIDRDDRDDSYSIASRKIAANQRRKYDDLDDDMPVNNYSRREVDIDNEEDHYNSRHSKANRHHAQAHDTRPIKRTNSRDMLVNSSSNRNASREYAKQPSKFDRDDLNDEPQLQDRKLRLTKFSSESNDYENFQHMRQ
jgi:hypothetical protein